MSAIPKQYISEQDYLEQERLAEHKSEYFNGEVFAMAGASESHNSIVANTIASLHPTLRGKSCKIYPSDLRVYNPQNGLYTYPDISIACGERKFTDDTLDTLTNPTVLIEVLSPSTEDYDRGTKFKLYRSIPSLQNYVLISSMEYQAEVYTKSGESWILTTAKGREAKLYISAIQLDLQLEDVYAQVDIDAEQAK
ncbi:Uma2 family endonuclease [Aridibaculum aurantiacum]|uniref:Uma2 family endonuclease n=1 Tax=Aridibaculum aurantiacum TaxID=2810307 RepID=UPI001A9754B8|nr:Uma2 family endonuclease [Aridibaculum aurantiacum]